MYQSGWAIPIDLGQFVVCGGFSDLLSRLFSELMELVDSTFPPHQAASFLSGATKTKQKMLIHRAP
ncbi:MAG: hypothetical protein V7752_13195 [Halopseudomonas sp.]